MRHIAQPGPMGNPARTVCYECGHAPWCRVHEVQVMVCGTGGPNGTPCKVDES